MFDRLKYKKFASMQLKNRWAVPILVTILVSLVKFIISLPDLQEKIENLKIYVETLQNGLLVNSNIPNSENTGLLLLIIPIIIRGILEVAEANLYLKMSKGPEPVSISLFFEGFNMWLKAALSKLYKTLWLFLWSLLFFIPAIIKFFSYSQVKYLITEYPEISIPMSLRISNEITKGNKMDLFVMYLTFLPLVLLCAVTCGIAIPWVVPYIRMSCVNAYHGMLKDAIKNERVTSKDLRS